jgi:hypothetical protein
MWIVVGRRPGRVRAKRSQILGHWWQVELDEARNPGRDHPEPGCLATLSEGSATKSDRVKPAGGRNREVLLYVEYPPLRRIGRVRTSVPAVVMSGCQRARPEGRALWIILESCCS